MVLEPFTDRAAHARSLIHTYVHLVRKLFANSLVHVTPFLHNLVRIVFVDEAHLINNLTMSKYKLMSSRKSGINYDFPPLEIYIFVNLPSNWKVIQ